MDFDEKQILEFIRVLQGIRLQVLSQMKPGYHPRLDDELADVEARLNFYRQKLSAMGINPLQ